jgi:uncharacterized protein YaaN involved in tellurite resistance
MSETPNLPAIAPDAAAMVRIKSEIDISDRSRLVTFGERAQRSALELQKTVTDATNEMMRQASEMMKSQAIDIEKQSQREIIDIETLEKTNRDLLDTISGVLNVQQEGRESGAEIARRLAQLTDELKTGLVTATT